VTVEIAGRAGPVAWSRSLFNGLAQVIVQSTRASGEVTLTARAEGLEAATATVRTLPSPLRPSVP